MMTRWLRVSDDGVTVSTTKMVTSMVAAKSRIILVHTEKILVQRRKNGSIIIYIREDLTEVL
jgi:uncharacterized protein with PIN domain